MSRLLLVLLLCSPCFGTSHYVWCGAGGTASGADFTNAFTDLPASMTRGDVYVVAGTVACKYGQHTFSDADSGTTLITLRKANATSDSGVAGWTASFGSVAATWQDATQADPGTATVFLWKFTTDYYSIDGITGNTDPTNGGPASFGFQVITANPNKSGGGIIVLDSSTSLAMKNITFNHLEYGGTGSMPFFGQVISTCNFAANINTITLPSGTFPFVTGDRIDGWTNAQAIAFSNIVTTSVSGGTITINSATNYCALNPYAVVLSGFRPYGIQTLHAAGNNNTYTNISITNSYFHDSSEAARLDNCYNCTVDHNYLARNISTPQQHGSMVQVGEMQNATISGPVTVSNNFVIDAVGTGVFEHLGQPTACASNCGTISGFNIIGNQVTCSSSAQGVDERCGAGHYTTSDNAGITCVTNSSFLNNTVYNIIAANGLGTASGTAGVDYLAACSTGNIAENNILYGCNYNCAFLGSTTHDFNLVLNSPTRSFTPNTHELVTHSGTTDPFINGPSFNLALTTDVGAIPTGCVLGTNCFQNGTNTHAVLTSNDVDYYGTARNSGNGWDIGALQFVPAAASYTVTAACAGTANGTILGSAGSVMNAVCTAGVCSGTCSESITAGASGTYTGAATTGSMSSFSIGACVTSPCTVTVNSPLTVTATFQTVVTCTLTLAANSLNSPATVSGTTALAGLSGPNSFWFVLDPLNTTISLCNYPYSGCNSSGQSGNLPYTVSGLYSLGACSNGVCCTGSTAPLNINTGAGSAAH